MEGIEYGKEYSGSELWYPELEKIIHRVIDRVGPLRMGLLLGNHKVMWLRNGRDTVCLWALDTGPARWVGIARRNTTDEEVFEAGIAISFRAALEQLVDFYNKGIFRGM